MILLVSLALGACGAWFVARYAFVLGLVDEPNTRSSHTRPTPRGGGVGLLAAFIVASLFLQIPWNYWLPATCLALVSFFDDRLDLSARFRLFFQFGAAGVAIVFLPFGEVSPVLLFFLFLFASIYIAGTTNFFNFMDGINGIAGMTGAVAFSLLSLFSWQKGMGEMQVLLPLCLAAACLGFLPFNLPSAQVFMGDVGSVLLGFVYSLLVIAFSSSIADFLCLTSFLFLFYADTLTTLFIRWRDGERLGQAHRRHLYQLLANELHVAHWKVSACYGLSQAGIGVVMILGREYGLLFQLTMWGILSLVFVCITRYVRRKC